MVISTQTIIDSEHYRTVETTCVYMLNVSFFALWFNLQRTNNSLDHGTGAAGMILTYYAWNEHMYCTCRMKHVIDEIKCVSYEWTN